MNTLVFGVIFRGDAIGRFDVHNVNDLLVN